MCNPRRIRVQAKRKIAEAWKAEIERAATARGDVSSEARLVQLIDDLLPRPARMAFERAMRDSADWAESGGEYRRAVPGGTITYRPDTGELEIVIMLSAAVEAVATAKLVAAGEVTDEVAAEASGQYYDDNYRGQTREMAETRARAAAEAKVAALADDRLAALKLEAEERARFELNARAGEAVLEARRSAERELTLKSDEMRTSLDDEAGRRLEEVQEETLKGIFQLVATGYSQALQAYAEQYGENLRVTEEDGVIQIQFELEQ
ncbi:hypothetical protein Daura_39835 [Dactylosporangium aurantiacum]|uniref:FtsH ternary system domain-containing protein n=1 Tax=Dactylosporangium aurantiacum TaxID=35754 RepID=A0A9Q9IGG0_9ACTN|nr:hypothetical protein [Dactylosporangium aurantiacum]MDG6101423.1 hypothetical protein [Dactylosporangium aurantiacum]UWZ52723.1 hypothetical protein Daura_39835 [Dactylosporangium aurantiacum]